VPPLTFSSFLSLKNLSLEKQLLWFGATPIQEAFYDVYRPPWCLVYRINNKVFGVFGGPCAWATMAMHHWKCVVEGEPEVDVNRFGPPIVVGQCALTPPDPQPKGAWYPGGFIPCTYQVEIRFQSLPFKMQLAPLHRGHQRQRPHGDGADA
jgi:hypothetical protein